MTDDFGRELARRQYDDTQRRQAEMTRQSVEASMRRAEVVRDANLADWMYWNAPGTGFWARMAQDDERRRFAEEWHRRQAHEAWYRQREGQIIGVLQEPASPAPLPELADADSLWRALRQAESPHSGGAANREFMSDMLERIAADAEHPLRFLVDDDGWLSRRADADDPTVQAGHLVSRHSGAEERFALEDSSYNQVSSNRGETQGYIFVKDAVEIGGVPVERRTAEMWERTGLLEAGTVERAERHDGWRVDAFRRIDVDAEDRRTQNQRREALEDWRYWNDPLNGFWARMKREDFRAEFIREFEARRHHR